MIEFVKNFWCQKVLPLVYTDALSYYEMLGKFVGKLNEVIGNVNNLNENTVFSVNNVKPVDGNVNVGTVKSVNGSTPDASGNVNLPQVSGVTSVDGIGADASGNVPLNAVKSVNGITPTDGNVNVGTVKSVNGNTPDSAGNVNAGTVKSVNGNAPDSSGNVNTGTVKSVNSVSPNESGNVNITAANVGAIPTTPNAVGFQNVDSAGLYPKMLTITDAEAVITGEWGKFVYLGGAVNKVTLSEEMLNSFPDSWHAILVNAGSGNITITLNAWLIDIDNGVSGMGRTFTLGVGKYVEIQRYSTAGVFLRGSFTRP